MSDKIIITDNEGTPKTKWFFCPLCKGLINLLVIISYQPSEIISGMRNHFISYVVNPYKHDVYHQHGWILIERYLISFYLQNPYMQDKLPCCIQRSG